MLYDTGFALDAKQDIHKAILGRVTEYEIYSYYLGHAFQIGVPFLSPFRKETRPSFNIFMDRGRNGLYHKDFGDSRFVGNCFSFVEQIHSGISYKDAINMIVTDMKFGKLKQYLGFLDHKPTEYTTKLRKVIQYEPKFNLTEVERKYWEDFGLTPNHLKFFKIYPAYRLFVDCVETWLSTAENPIFIYKVFDKIKGYRPLEENKSRKWISNCSRYDIQGWEQLPEMNETDTIIITKSLKDVAVLRTLGYLAIAPSSESVMIPPTAMKMLASKGIKRFIILFDRDHGGMMGAKKMFTAYRGTYNITFKFIGRGHPKDIADFRRAYGERSAQRYIKYLIGYDSNEKLKVFPANGTQTTA
jgi:hypothetical protein